MKIAETVAEVRQQVKAWRKEGLTVGLVPTMGYLHEGHQSLIAKACEQNDRVVVSVFVNPTQFGPNEDLESYPRDLEHDAALCESTGAALIFHPTPAEMYPKGFCSFVDMDVLTKELCGLSRPVHFRGVCTVVSKLLHIVQPDRAYFGEKDAQQLAVIRRMVLDLNMDVEIVGCPIVREADGLAKSSRNTYLSPEERKAANAALCAFLWQLAAVQNAQTILLYAAFGSEADLSALAEKAQAQGKTLAYPVCGEAYSLTAAVPGPDGWEMGQYGIRTPILSRSEILLPEALDLVLVPCTAFDADCFRVGMGKGYYDRYLPRCKNAVKIGIAFEAQRVEHAAVDEHDQRLDAYVTERGIYKWK